MKDLHENGSVAELTSELNLPITVDRRRRRNSVRKRICDRVRHELTAATYSFRVQHAAMVGKVRNQGAAFQPVLPDRTRGCFSKQDRRGRPASSRSRRVGLSMP